MDEKPFLSFDINSILTTASELKYSNAIKLVFTSELLNPCPEFIKYFVNKVYTGMVTEKVMLQFTDIVKKTIDKNKKEQRYELGSLDEIFMYSEQLNKSAERYVAKS
jgi:hypothetical protein